MRFHHADPLNSAINPGKAGAGKQRPALLFSLLLLIGMLVSMVCDLSISGRLTWSLFPALSILLVWLVFFPIVLHGKEGIFWGLLALSLSLLPFLYGLDRLIQGHASILPAGGRMAVIGAAFLWIVFALFRFWRNRKLLAVAVSCLAAIPGCAAVNLTLSGILGCPVLDRWDLLSFLVLIALSALFFLLDLRAR